jgi:hypothetical protein
VQSPLQSGDTDVTDNVTLVGAQTLEALGTITQDQPSATTCAATGVGCTVFLGRTIAVPEIPVWIVDNLYHLPALQYVPVGTTLANLVERFIPLPVDPNQAWSVVNTNRISTALGSLGSVPINPASQTSPSPVPSTMWDVPLVGGDSVNFNNF